MVPYCTLDKLRLFTKRMTMSHCHVIFFFFLLIFWSWHWTYIAVIWLLSFDCDVKPSFYFPFSKKKFCLGLWTQPSLNLYLFTINMNCTCNTHFQKYFLTFRLWYRTQLLSSLQVYNLHPFSKHFFFVQISYIEPSLYKLWKCLSHLYPPPPWSTRSQTPVYWPTVPTQRSPLQTLTLKAKASCCVLIKMVWPSGHARVFENNFTKWGFIECIIMACIYVYACICTKKWVTPINMTFFLHKVVLR